MRIYLIPATIACVVGLASSPVYASTLIADGITYSLTETALNSTTEQSTLGISGINGPSDTEQGRYGVQSFAFNKPANFSSATAPTGFTFEAGGLSAGGCNGHGNFFCFSGSTPSGPALAANSVLDFVFDVTLSSGSFAGYDPGFKINWDGTKNNYDLVSLDLAPSVSATPLPGTLPLFVSALGLLAFVLLRKKREALHGLAAA